MAVVETEQVLAAGDFVFAETVVICHRTNDPTNPYNQQRCRPQRAPFNLWMLTVALGLLACGASLLHRVRRGPTSST